MKYLQFGTRVNTGEAINLNNSVDVTQYHGQYASHADVIKFADKSRNTTNSSNGNRVPTI